MNKLNSTFLIIFFVGISMNSNAQELDSLKLDSLISVLTLQSNDSEMVNAYNEMTNDYLRILDYEIAEEYAVLGRDLAREIDNEEGELEALCNLAHIHSSYHLQYQEAVHSLDRAYELANKLDHNDYKIRIYRGYTAIYSATSEFDKALTYNELAIVLAKDMNDESVVSDLSAYGGNIYEAIGDTLKAIELYKNVVDIETASNFQNSSKAALITIAHYYYMIGEHDKSIQHYKSALTKFERLKDMRWVAYTHSELAKLYLETERFEKAEFHGLLGLETAESMGLNKEIGDNYSVLADLYLASGNERKEDLYRSKYDSLILAAEVDIISHVDVEYEGSAEATEKSSNSPRADIISMLVILGIVVLSVFLYGLSAKKK
ncbi:MAG: tetratricopeptide (TPR) repeat protein [Arenicella sp.]|jgi:tetratricopeptide (TPR) repeat protein